MARALSSSSSGLMSMPGIQEAKSLPIRVIWLRSLMNALSAPGYCTFTATTRPSRQTALCTWPIDAAAAGVSSNSANRSRQSSPSSSRRIAWIDSAGMGGADSCSRVSASRYGPASSSGMAASKMLIAWPIFMAPPLSSPSTLNICSAVRACSSALTASAGLPPMRLPRPHAARPAWAAGSAAIFTLRVMAYLGMSGTRPLSPVRRLCTSRVTGWTTGNRTAGAADAGAAVPGPRAG